MLSGASKTWSNQGFFYWIYRLLDAATQLKLLLTVLFTRLVSGFFDILIGCLVIGISHAFKVRLAVDMQGVLHKWMPQEKYVKYSISWQTFICHYPRNVLAKFHENPSDLHTGPINSLKVDVFLPKSNAKFYLVKVNCKQLIACQETISPHETANQ